MSAQPPADRAREAVEIQPILLGLLSELRARLPSTTKLQRRLEARGLRVKGSERSVSELLGAFVEGACEGATSVEFSLIGVHYSATHPSREGPGAGVWIRVAARREVTGPAAPSRFDLPGLPFAVPAKKLPDEDQLQCAQHLFDGRSLAQMYLRCLDPLPSRRPLAAPTRILFVDDDPMILEVHRQSLESLGYDVVDCNESRRALEMFALHAEAFDLLLSDCSMPGIEGGELARRVREIRADLPVVLSSGLQARADESDRGGRVETLAKPFTLEELAVCLARVLGHA